MTYDIDILEEGIIKLGKSLLDCILKDRTINRNIIWETNDYAEFADAYVSHREILPELITKNYIKNIQPRITK